MHGSLASTAERERWLSELMRTHRQRAIHLAWRLLGDSAAAEDAAQEAFVRAWRSIDRFEGRASLSTWFYRILIRTAQSHRRRRRLLAFLGWGQSEIVNVYEAAAEHRSRISAAIQALPRGQREAFVLVRLQEFSIGEAAAILECAEGTVKSHLHRATRTLQGRLHDLVAPVEE